MARLAALAGTHFHRHLGDGAAGADRHDQRIDGVPEVLGRIVVQVLDDGALVGGPEPAGDIGQPGLGEGGDDLREQLHRPFAGPGDLVGPAVGEAGTDGDVRVLQTGQDFIDVPGIVLAVGVDLDHLDVAEAAGVLEAGPHRTSDAEVEGQVQDGRAGGRSLLRRRVRGTVVDDQYVVPGVRVQDLSHRAADDVAFIPGRHDDQNAR